jgi:uncharacterized protein DUF6788
LVHHRTELGVGCSQGSQNQSTVSNRLKNTMNESQRKRLIQQIQKALPQALLGSLSETYRKCGNANCRCHHGGPKHGPHLYVSYRGATGKTTGYYVPAAAHASVRTGVEAWSQIQQCLRQLSFANKELLLPSKSKGRPRKRAA